MMTDAVYWAASSPLLPHTQPIPSAPAFPSSCAAATAAAAVPSIDIFYDSPLRGN